MGDEVRNVPVPPQSLALTALPRIDFADAYAATLPDGCDPSLDEVARIALTAFPWWIGGLMRLRDLVVRTFGLKTANDAARSEPRRERGEAGRERMEPGDFAGFFRLLDRTDTQLLFGENDAHLDFRVAMSFAGGDERSVVLVTTVHIKNRLGRAYFSVVRHGHRIVVPAMLREARRRMARAARQPVS
jgi:uncharacterized protein DUF2867